MPVVQIPDADAYDKAVAVLIRYGGAFSGRDPQVLMLNPSQYRELVKVGLVESGSASAASEEGRTRD